MLSFETQNRIHKILRRLVIEKRTGFTIDDRLYGSASAIGNCGTTCGSHLEWRHTKILFTWENKRTRTRHIMFNFFVRNATSSVS